MAEYPLRPALGNYAAGERFWDRQREVSKIRWRQGNELGFVPPQDRPSRR